MTEETLFAAALERPAGAERRAFLDAACAGDAALRRRVERLLAADEHPRGILDRTGAVALELAAGEPDSATADRPPPAGPAGVIDPGDLPDYELLEEVGQGGMGVVYRARDARLARDVAVKVLHPRYAADGPAARRFLEEARVTAQLQHPGVPPVHEAGALPDGRPFLAMKLIKGRTLADLLADPATDRGRLVAAFEGVCQAVAYAHAKGVIHRDLKPANVMVGAFGEVQVMDWGLAKVLAPRGPAAPPAHDETLAAESMIDSDRGAGDATRAGSVLGTPAYMPPEQAIGAVDQADARSDVFGLGAILCAVLTGKPPYAGADAEAVRQMAARAKLGDAFARLDESGADPCLVELCKRCLAAEKADRPADAGEVAAAAAGLRAAADERVRAAELDRVRAEGERAKAEAETREQRKRRRVQLALAGVVVLAAVAGGVAAYRVEQQRSADTLRAEQQRADDRIAADEKRRAAEQQTRAETLVQAIATADTAALPRLFADLAEVRDLARPKLIELAGRPVGTRAGLHGRLAVLADEPGRAAELAAYLPTCRPEELLTLRDALLPHAAAVAPPLWEVLADETAEPGKRVRAASALAGLARDDPRWAGLAPGVAEAAVKADPVEFVAWSQALEPVRGALLPALVRRYPVSRERIEAGKLTVSDLAAEASGYDLTANLLARYAADRPADLAELAVAVDARHHALFAAAVAKNRAAVVPLLTAELGRRVVVPEDKIVVEYRGTIAADDPRVKHSGGRMAAKRFEVRLSGGKTYRLTMDSADFDSYLALHDPAGKEVGVNDDGGGGENSLIEYTPTGDGTYGVFASAFKGTGGFVLRVVEPAVGVEEEQVTLARRQANAAAVLLALGEAEAVWPLFRHTQDPTARSYLVHRAAGVGVDPAALVGRFRAEADVSAKRAVLLALGEYPPAAVPDRAGLTAELCSLYKSHPDPGLHGSIDWLLRQRWGKAAELTAIDTDMAGRAKGGGPGKTDKGWFVNGEGQTYAVIRGPVEFTLGSPASEPGRNAGNEPPHRKRISRTFAIAAKEVTVAEYLRFRPPNAWVKQYSPDRGSPAVAVTWYQAAEYCNWLSEKAGIPEQQWCYEPNGKKEYGEGMTIRKGHLGLTGYRLPTEAEWEYACRAEAGTARSFGRANGLLPFYAWGLKTADDRAWPVGRLKPNDLGLFDALGNALEWVEGPGLLYATGVVEDGENVRYLSVNDQTNRSLRGGSFTSSPANLRCANRYTNRPSNVYFANGFRPSRTLLD